MCGIAGIINTDGEAVNTAVLEGMSETIRHRGPDDTGLWVRGNVGFAHRRLSIIDLSRHAHQPMSNEDGTIVVIHNGEIYNYLELMEELKRSGHVFVSKSDTEVIIHAYEQWGSECLAHFNGMWSFALWDARKKTLFASRDRFGVKPFYYRYDGNHLVFASEIKALLVHPIVPREPNDQAIYQYLISGYGYMDISRETFFKNIRQLSPAHYFLLSVDEGALKEVRYWDLDPRSTTPDRTIDAVADKFLFLFEDAVRLRLRSDVSVGISLSGGLDSSSVACVVKKISGNTPLEGFSSCFEEEEFDERKFIRPVIERTGIRPNYIFTKPEHLFRDLEDILWHQEEPYSTLSIFPQWYVMKLAREKGVKVLLTGQAGDETLAGYPKYFFYLFADLISSGQWKKALREMGIYSDRNASNAARLIVPIANIIAAYCLPRPLKDMAGAFMRRPEYLNRDFSSGHSNEVFMVKKFSSILNNDLYNALRISPLPSLLHIDDRSSMAHSVESRAPFLDYRLVEFLFSVPAELKIQGGITKYILRHALKGILPEEVRTRQDKLGFPTPLREWFKTVLRGRVEELLHSREFASRPYFDRAGVQKKFKEYLEGRDDLQYTVWSWVNLELWFRKFIDSRSVLHGVS